MLKTSNRGERHVAHPSDGQPVALLPASFGPWAARGRGCRTRPKIKGTENRVPPRSYNVNPPGSVRCATIR